jgi:hypothetical protein
MYVNLNIDSQKNKIFASFSHFKGYIGILALSFTYHLYSFMGRGHCRPAATMSSMAEVSWQAQLSTNGGGSLACPIHQHPSFGSAWGGITRYYMVLPTPLVLHKTYFKTDVQNLQNIKPLHSIDYMVLHTITPIIWYMNTALDMRFCAEPYTLGVGSGWGPDFPQCH